MDVTTLISWTRPFPILGVLSGIFHLHAFFLQMFIAHSISKQWRSWSDYVRIQKVIQRGSNFENFFLLLYLVNEWIWIPLKYWAIMGLPAKRHFNGVSLACRWWPNIECWLGSFVIFQGFRTSIAKKPYILWFFRGGVRIPCPPLDPHMQTLLNSVSVLGVHCLSMSHEKGAKLIWINNLQ